MIKDLLSKIKCFNGEAYVKLENGYPYYTRGCAGGKDMCIKAWRLFGNVYFSVRKRYVNGFSEYGKNKLCGIFGWNSQFEKLVVIADGSRYYIEDMPWILVGEGWRKVVGHPQVVFNTKTLKYYGFSHRACMGFGVGDMLFDIGHETEKTKVMYCNNKSFRKAFIKVLKEYDKDDDAWSFNDTLKNGIVEVVPFRMRGTKIIETRAEALKAADNFADYVS